MHSCFDGAEIACTHSPVETPYTLIPQSLSDAIKAIAILPTGRPGGICSCFVKLQPCLDQPNWVCCGGCGETGADCGLRVNERGIFRLSQKLGPDVFAVSVYVELDSGRRNHTSNTRTKTSEESAPALSAVY